MLAIVKGDAKSKVTNDFHSFATSCKALVNNVGIIVKLFDKATDLWRLIKDFLKVLTSPLNGTIGRKI
jgi:hypothetical protein